jgi:EAL domain-containing protein (putative c-di-GMP-specific phosphodiesterase class I)
MRDAAAWQAKWPHISVAVNVPASSLTDNGFPNLVEAELAAAGLHPSKLTLEVTESTAMADQSVSGEVLTRLRIKGVQLALDDFGTGYSSLSYLGLFPVDVLKIDRSFLRGVGRGEDVALAKGIVELGRAMGLETVAEGIEEEDQLATVEGLGCGYGQGFLFARPMAPDQIEALLERPKLRRQNASAGRIRRRVPARATGAK